MKKLIKAFICLALFYSPLMGQEELGNVSNVDWNYDTLTEKIVITYDLSRVGTERYFQIAVSAIFDGQPFTPSTGALEGDVGNYVRSGLSKRITWDVSQDIFFTENTSLQIKVTSRKVQSTTPGTESSTTGVLPEPNIFIPIGAGVLGGGLVVAGLSSKNSDDVKTYESTCDPESSSFNPSAVEVNGEGVSQCDMLYDEAKSDHSTGNTLLAVGASVVIAGVGWFVKQKMDQAAALSTLRGAEDNSYLKIQPTLGINNIAWQGGPVGTLGMKFTLQF